MKLSITQPKSLAGNDYTKYYFKLVGLKFDCDTVKKAKKYYKGIYKQVSCFISEERQWVIEDDCVVVQVCDLQKQPMQTIYIKHDDTLTLIYAQEQFKIKDLIEQKKLDASVSEL